MAKIIRRSLFVDFRVMGYDCDFRLWFKNSNSTYVKAHCRASNDDR